MKKTFCLNFFQLIIAICVVILCSIIYSKIKINPTTIKNQHNFDFNIVELLKYLIFLLIILFKTPIVIVVKPLDNKIIFYYYYKIVVFKNLSRDEIFIKTENIDKKKSDNLYIRNKLYKYLIFWNESKIKEIVNYFCLNCGDSPTSARI
ncbi:MAG: hypothetical protein U0V72_14610 [Cytophagales bacterium]